MLQRSVRALSSARLLHVPLPAAGGSSAAVWTWNCQWDTKKEKKLWLGDDVVQDVTKWKSPIGNLFKLDPQTVEVFNAKGTLATVLRDTSFYYITGKSADSSNVDAMSGSTDVHEPSIYSWVQLQAILFGSRRSKAEREFLVAAFNRFDLDGNTYLDAHELKLACQHMKIPNDSELFGILDKNRDHVISLNEWLDLLPDAVLRDLKATDGAKFEAWARADVDMARDAWKMQVLRQMYERPGMDRDDFARLVGAFEAFDLDRDRILDSTEIRTALASFNMSADESDKVFVILDSDASNDVTLEEWLDNLPEDLKLSILKRAKRNKWRVSLKVPWRPLRGSGYSAWHMPYM